MKNSHNSLTKNKQFDLKMAEREFPRDPVVKTQWFQSLVRELRSPKPQDARGKKGEGENLNTHYAKEDIIVT